MSHYEAACEYEAARFIKKCREREARARFSEEPVLLTGFGEPEDIDTLQAIALEDSK